MKPLVFDLFSGLFGWGEAFSCEGWRVVGFDIEDQFKNFGKEIPGNCELVLRDIRSINGAELVREYGVPACIVASPPCQEFSYMAMPWSKAKDKLRKIEADPAEQKRLTDLFNQCFRIQREVSQACGHHVPMVVENVRGAQRWVGRSLANFGSFHLWGDVPALMPIPQKAHKFNPDGTNHPAGSWFAIADSKHRGAKSEDEKVGISWSKSGPGNTGKSFQTAAMLKSNGNKSAGMNWSDRSKKGPDFTRIAGKQAAGSKVPSQTGRRTDPGKGARFTSRDCGEEGVKQSGIGGIRDNGKSDAWFQNGAARSGSKSSARKQASAEIAKIPPALAQWIARVLKPKGGKIAT